MRYAFCVAEDINLGVGYMMAYLKQQGHEVRLFFDPLQFNRAYARNGVLSRALSIENANIRKIKKFNPDVCCFSCVTATYKWALRVAEKVKKEVGCKIVFGGVHPTLCPEEVGQHKFIDDIVQGDGVEFFGGKFNPDELWPDRESFFKELPSFHRKYQLFMTSYGCPFRCSYCNNEALHKKVFRRSIKGCIDELKFLKNNGMEYVLFVDDILTCDRGWLLNFLPEYKREVGLPFACFIHPKFMDEKVAAKLKEAGCHTAWMGIQTGVEQLRKDILNRPETNEEIKKACELVKKHGIKLMIDHIFGIPYETEISNEFSHVFYAELKPDVVNCYELLYLPKAKIIDHAIRFGYLLPQDVSKIERGEMLQYHTGNKGHRHYDLYHKPMVIIPLGSVVWEMLPTAVAKLLVHIKAGRWWMPVVIIQNELFFTWKALLNKVGIA